MGSTDDLIPTRATLLHRLKNWQDQASWQDFFDTYWRLIYNVAIKGGLSETEAQDVVQETMVSVAKHMPKFRYDPALGSFKTWLLNMTRWRIVDQFRMRGRLQGDQLVSEESDTAVRAFGGLADPAANFEAIWEAEWSQNLLDSALDRVKRKVDPQKYQIFDLYVNQNWPPEKLAKSFGIPVDQVYLAKHRITNALKDEVRRLESEVI